MADEPKSNIEHGGEFIGAIFAVFIILIAIGGAIGLFKTIFLGG